MNTASIPVIKTVMTARGTIINELCTCGHLQSNHAGALRHGICEFGQGCGCQKFAWASFVFANQEIWGRSAKAELRALRRAIDANCFGSGPSVIGRATRGLRQFRIVGVKLRRGLIYGKELATCKWVEISEWETF